MKFFIITGMSGAGKSRAMDVFEDLGYYCVDNMPLSLIPRFAELCMDSSAQYKNVAIVTDVRAGTDFGELFEALNALSNSNFAYKILFLDASTDMLINRYKESRRRHPLDLNGEGLVASVTRERQLLEDIRSRADFVVDTSLLSVQKLREHLISLFADDASSGKMVITVLSFGYKYGIPAESDLVFDVRFLPNPYYEPSLRRKAGNDPEVYEYVFASGLAGIFMDKLRDLMDFLIPNYIQEGKSSLVISIGCTGGRHRSVAIAGDITKHFEHSGYNTVLHHRDIDK